MAVCDSVGRIIITLQPSVLIINLCWCLTPVVEERPLAQNYAATSILLTPRIAISRTLNNILRVPIAFATRKTASLECSSGEALQPSFEHGKVMM